MSESSFNNEVYSGPTKNDFTIRVDDSRGIAFETTQGITREEFNEKNRRTVDDLFKQEEIGSVFETREKKLEEKALSNGKNEIKPTTNNGIDSNAVDTLKRELSDQHKMIQQSSVGSNLGL